MNTNTNNDKINEAVDERNTPSQRRLFPFDGKVRVKEAAPFLGVAVSSYWLFVKQGRIKQPMRYGKRVSVWDAEYIRDLAKNGIPAIEVA